jgi:hypothetical protein
MFERIPRWVFYTMILLYVAIVASLIVVFADDTEDPGRTPWIDQMLKRVQEWNIMTELNKTLHTAERFEK